MWAILPLGTMLSEHYFIASCKQWQGSDPLMCNYSISFSQQYHLDCPNCWKELQAATSRLVKLQFSDLFWYETIIVGNSEILPILKQICSRRLLPQCFPMPTTTGDAPWLPVITVKIIVVYGFVLDSLTSGHLPKDKGLGDVSVSDVTYSKIIVAQAEQLSSPVKPLFPALTVYLKSIDQYSQLKMSSNGKHQLWLLKNKAC